MGFGNQTTGMRNGIPLHPAVSSPLYLFHTVASVTSARQGKTGEDKGKEGCNRLETVRYPSWEELLLV